MKLSRYSASGITHRNGTLATSIAIWLVSASSIVEAHAPRAIHSARTPAVGGGGAGSAGAAAAADASGPRSTRSAIVPHSAAKPANAQYQTDACRCEPRFGSTRNGKVRRPSSEPMFDSA